MPLKLLQHFSYYEKLQKQRELIKSNFDNGQSHAGKIGSVGRWIIVFASSCPLVSEIKER